MRELLVMSQVVEGEMNIKNKSVERDEYLDNEPICSCCGTLKSSVNKLRLLLDALAKKSAVIH